MLILLSSEERIKVFKLNRQIVQTGDLAKRTEKLVSQTTVYKNPLTLAKEKYEGKGRIHFLSEDTVTEILSLVNDGYSVCVLSPADPMFTGGLVEVGGTDQEEVFCQCSNLYESLISDVCQKDFYAYHIWSKDNVKFSDRVIYSKGVSIFRKSTDFDVLAKTGVCDVLSCTPPSSSLNNEEYIQTLYRRFCGIVNVLQANGMRILVLGAWGTETYKGDPTLIGRIFAMSLKLYNCFDDIYICIENKDVLSKFKTGISAVIPIK